MSEDYYFLAEDRYKDLVLQMIEWADTRSMHRPLENHWVCVLLATAGIFPETSKHDPQAISKRLRQLTLELLRLVKESERGPDGAFARLQGEVAALAVSELPDIARWVEQTPSFDEAEARKLVESLRYRAMQVTLNSDCDNERF